MKKMSIVLRALNPFSSSGNIIVDVLYAMSMAPAIAVTVELIVYL